MAFFEIPDHKGEIKVRGTFASQAIYCAAIFNQVVIWEFLLEHRAVLKTHLEFMLHLLYFRVEGFVRQTLIVQGIYLAVYVVKIIIGLLRIF